MLHEHYLADWQVDFPSTRDASATWNLLNGSLICNWSWDHFIWNLVDLHRLLSERPAEFNYLYVTQFLKARAAYLAMNGPFSSRQTAVLEGIARHQLQFSAIYRFLFMFGLERALATQDGAPGMGLSEGRLFRVDIGMIEKTYLEILEVISLMPDSETMCHGYRIEDWTTGELREDGKAPVQLVPEAVPVPVEIEEVGRYRKVTPAREEHALKILARDRIRCFRERNGEGTSCDRNLERLWSWEKIGGYPLVKCGDDYIEYYNTTVNDEKDTLYVICADCTMRLKRAGRSDPGSRPKEIHLSWPAGERTMCSLDTEVEYLVEFKDGTSDVFLVSFRPHRENEKHDVPRRVWAKAVTAEGDAHGQATSGDLFGHSPAALATGESSASLPNDRDVGETGADLKETNADGATSTDEEKAVSEIIGDYRRIVIGGEEIVFGKKHKRRGFVRFLHGRKKRTGEDTFYFEEMKEEYERATGKAIRSDRFEEDLFKDQSREFHLLFEELDKGSGLYRLKV